MKILSFAASNSKNSINKELVQYASRVLQQELLPNAEIELLDLNDYEMAIYSPDREQATGIPSEAQAFYEKIGAADAVIVSFAEYNGFVTAAWKNIFDWMSRIDMKVWQGKPMVMLAASPGGRAGANVLASQEMLAPFFGADLRGKHGVGSWYDAWDAETKKLKNSEDIAAVNAALEKLID